MANPEHVDRLLQGVEAWNQWRQENPEIRPDLRRANLRRIDLRYADLHRVDLKEANLREADLRETNLIGSYLRAAILILKHLYWNKCLHELSRSFF